MLKLGHSKEYASQLFKTTKEIDNSQVNHSVYDEIYKNNKDNLLNTALIYENNNISFMTLFKKSIKTAEALSSYGISEGSNIVVCSNSVPEFAYLILACSKIGACIITIPPFIPEHKFEELINCMHINLFFIEDRFFDNFANFKSLRKCVNTIILPSIEKSSYLNYFDKNSNICTWNKFFKIKTNNVSNMVKNGDNVLFVCATTGSTGIPKNIAITNKSIIILKEYIKSANINWCPKDQFYSHAPSFIVSGISFALLCPLMLGVTVVLQPRLNYDNKFLDNVINNKSNIVFCTKSMWMYIVYNYKNKIDLSFIKYAYTVGEPISINEYKIINKFLSKNNALCSLHNMYGMSELNSMVTYHSDTLSKKNSSGFLIPYIRAAIFDPVTFQEKKLNNYGELYVQSPANMKEYLNDIKHTNDFFIEDNFGEIWCKTGDIAKIYTNGEINILCRQSEMFTDKHGSIIYPFEIEKIVLKDKNILQCKAISTIYEDEKVLSLHCTLKSKNLNYSLYYKIIENIIKSSNLIILPKLIKIWDYFPLGNGDKIDTKKMVKSNNFYICKQ